jgi:hypothetical protein
MFLRRLTNQEYAATLRDLLGAEPSVQALPPDLTLHGFDNNAESISITPAHLEAYRSIAESAVSDLLASSARRATVVGCDPVADQAHCLESFVRRFGLRAFRRPLESDEVSDLMTLGGTSPAGEGPWGPMGRVIEAMLQSPSFLFKVEVGKPATTRPGLVALSGYEMATRLSYLLFGTTPDDQLLQAAERGELDTAEASSAKALAMLDDSARARPAVWSFASQWLRVVNLNQVDRPADQFPRWSQTLSASMAEETRRVVERFTDLGAAPLLGLLDTPTTFVDSNLAALYGLPSPAAGAWSEVTLPPDRRGILTHASLLTLTANTHGTTPILRGKYIRQALLCDDLPPPPPQVPNLPPPRPGLGERERLAEHRVSAACSGCHSLLEPLGFGLSQFDAIGAYRTVDDAGLPVDASGVIDGLADASFVGAVELSERLRREPKVGACASTHLLRFALGRSETASDDCTIAQLAAVLQQGGDFRTLVGALTATDSFRYRLASDADRGGQP